MNAKARMAGRISGLVSGTLPGLMIGVLLMAGCSQADRANTHLGSMDDTSKAMLEELKKTEKTFDAATKQVEAIATALTALKDMGLDVMNLMKTAFARKPAGGSDDIGAVLGEPVIAPGAGAENEI